MFKNCLVFLILFSLGGIVSCTAKNENAPPDKTHFGVDLSPSSWGPGELEEFVARDLDRSRSHLQVTGKTNMVTGLLSSRAVRAAMEALNQGGTAMDAALTGALTEITLSWGQAVSYAGILNILYFKADEQKVYNLNAGYNLPAEENASNTIPPQEVPSGRSVLVPGFMAGVQEGHRRFGKLPFSALFSPAVYFAEQGTPAELLGFFTRLEQDRIFRLPAGRELFLKGDKDPSKDENYYSLNDIFLQPQLARTLKRVAFEGADYMYRGNWASKFVKAVRLEGGNISMADMQNYRATWEEPTKTDFEGHTIYAPGVPALGGVQLIEAFNVLTASNLIDLYGDYKTSAISLFALMKIVQANLSITFFPIPVLNPLIPLFGQVRTDPVGRQTQEHADALWEAIMNANTPPASASNDPEHSSGFVVVDSQGNVAVLAHTINTTLWGGSGIVVDGIPIPDSASFQQALLARVEPGERFPDLLATLAVFKDDRFVLGSSCVGRAGHEVTVQVALDLLLGGLDPKTSIESRKFSSNNGASQLIQPGQFPQPILDALNGLGQTIELDEDDSDAGLWVGIHRNDSGYSGMTTNRLFSPGTALGR